MNFFYYILECIISFMATHYLFFLIMFTILFNYIPASIMSYFHQKWSNDISNIKSDIKACNIKASSSYKHKYNMFKADMSVRILERMQNILVRSCIIFLFALNHFTILPFWDFLIRLMEESGYPELFIYYIFTDFMRDCTILLLLYSLVKWLKKKIYGR